MSVVSGMMSLVRILCSCEGRRLTEENDQTPQNADSDPAVFRERILVLIETLYHQWP
ncbi:MAG TPA: hypothetical protein VEI50_12335 [Nitrospiraceae bacterium]|nr:hypothetical protein [Nitrospiraceae bacterium]